MRSVGVIGLPALNRSFSKPMWCRFDTLETLIDRLSALGATSTSTVLSSPVERRDYQAKQIESFAKYD